MKKVMKYTSENVDTEPSTQITVRLTESIRACETLTLNKSEDLNSLLIDCSNSLLYFSVFP